MADPGPHGDRAATIKLLVKQPMAVDLGRANEALTNLEWLGLPRDGRSDTLAGRHVRTDLELQIRDGSGPSPIRIAALIEVGFPEAVDGTVVVEISWQSATLAPLFPVFAGRLIVHETELAVTGYYAPPLGRLGVLIDARLLHFVARRTALALLSRLAAGLV